MKFASVYMKQPGVLFCSLLTVPANVTITYLTGKGEKVVKTRTIPAKSRDTVFVNTDLGWNQDVSTSIKSDQPIVAERPMYFDTSDGRRGGHDAMAVPAVGQ